MDGGIGKKVLQLRGGNDSSNSRGWCGHLHNFICKLGQIIDVSFV